MRWLKNTVLELWGLFVDDASFAVAIVAWIVIGVFVLRRCVPPPWPGPVFFLGIAVVLIENAARSARRSRRL
jgi:hypothetical protein